MNKNGIAIELPVPSAAKDREVISAQAARIHSLRRNLMTASDEQLALIEENGKLRCRLRDQEKALARVQADIDRLDQEIREGVMG